MDAMISFFYNQMFKIVLPGNVKNKKKRFKKCHVWRSRGFYIRENAVFKITIIRGNFQEINSGKDKYLLIGYNSIGGFCKYVK
jgi:hypothetical protein